MKEVEKLLRNAGAKRVVQRLESAICEYCGAKEAVTFSSLSGAFFALFSVLGIKLEDEVIASPISEVAGANMFTYLGAKPSWCDIKLDGNIDERLLEKSIGAKTKVVLAADFTSKPARQLQIGEIAKRHALWHVEDATSSFGSAIEGKKVGTLADATVFRLESALPFGGSQACVTTENEEIARKLRIFRTDGVERKRLWNTQMQNIGFELALGEFDAANALVALSRLDDLIKRRGEIAACYEERFSGAKLFMTQKIEPQVHSARQFYPIVLNPELQCPKEDIYKTLRDKGVDVSVHYKPIYQYDWYKKRFGQTSLYVANDFYRSEITLPCRSGMGIEEAERIAETVLEVLQHYRYRGCSF